MVGPGWRHPHGHLWRLAVVNRNHRRFGSQSSAGRAHADCTGVRTGVGHKRADFRSIRPHGPGQWRASASSTRGPAFSGRACPIGFPPVARRHQDGPVPRLSLPEGDQPARDLALSAVHAQPVRRRGAARGAQHPRDLRDGPGLDRPLRAADRQALTPPPWPIGWKLTSGRSVREDRRSAVRSLACRRQRGRGAGHAGPEPTPQGCGPALHAQAPEESAHGANRAHHRPAEILRISHPRARRRWRTHPGERKNNGAEGPHVPIRLRERGMQGFRSPGSGQRFLAAHAAVANTFTTCRHLISAATNRRFRAETFTAWHEVAKLVE